MALLYGRAGRFTVKNGGFWPGQVEKDFDMNSCCVPRIAKEAIGGICDLKAPPLAPESLPCPRRRIELG